MEYWRYSASQALDKLRSGDLTVEQYASSLLERIQQRNEDVQAWAYLDSNAVLEQARALDKVPFEQRGPLHGLPVGIKDIILTKGKSHSRQLHILNNSIADSQVDMPTEHGSSIYKNDHPKIDAGSVMVLRHAGCLIFGEDIACSSATLS
jgi:Asp-tRNA(Asn)/Glu-tRNA(Gln) amidotransferase A subunit family amidase